LNKCALILTDGKEGRTLPSRFGEPARSTLLEYVLDSVWTVADEMFVIFGTEPSLATVERIAPFGVKAVIDRASSGPFSMIMAGVGASTSDSCLVVPAESPFVKPSVLYQLFELIRGFDAAIPKWKNGRTEPLLSVYSRRAFLKAASGLKKPTLPKLVDSLYDIRYVGVEEMLQPIDPELESFFRVRTDADLRKARALATSRAR
jgi:molybdopterin-guanine dinucleotide biosynthesis protein A